MSLSLFGLLWLERFMATLRLTNSNELESAAVNAAWPMARQHHSTPRRPAAALRNNNWRCSAPSRLL